MAARTVSPAGRRLGYVIGAGVNVVLLYVVLVWPGWESVPFLTQATDQVIGLVALSLLVGVATNLVYVVADRPWVRALGEVLSTAITLAVITRTLRVFPFDFGDATFDWETTTRVLLILLTIATSLALVAQMVRLGRLIIGREPDRAE